MSNLTTEQMVEAAEVFREATRFVLSSTPPTERRALQEFLASLVIGEKPYLLVTQEGLGRAIQLVWSNPKVSDFVMSVSFVFFARWGHSDEAVEGLCRNLARGVAMVTTDFKDQSAVPQVMGERLSDMVAATQLIQANKWLVIILMFQLFVTAGPEGDLK